MRKGREAALQMLFQLDGTGLEPAGAVDEFWNHLCESREGRVFDKYRRGVLDLSGK